MTKNNAKNVIVKAMKEMCKEEMAATILYESNALKFARDIKKCRTIEWDTTRANGTVRDINIYKKGIRVYVVIMDVNVFGTVCFNKSEWRCIEALVSKLAEKHKFDLLNNRK
jgi:hypothetical protein